MVGLFPIICLVLVASDKLAFSKATITSAVDKITMFIGLLCKGNPITIPETGEGRAFTTAVLECASGVFNLQPGGPTLGLALEVTDDLDN